MHFEFISGFAVLIGYFLVCAGSALILRKFVRFPQEIFRKILHIILLGSVFVFTYMFQTWWISGLASLGFIIIVYPILALAERLPWYSHLLVERKAGEIKRSLITAFFMFAVLILVCWGLFGQKFLVIASVAAWGFGDAAAALVGKRFGKRYIEGEMVEGRKTLEGTLAMFVVSFVAVLVALLIYQPVRWYGYVPISVIAAAVCALVELFTKDGMDTLTCPLATAAVLIPLVRLLGV